MNPKLSVCIATNTIDAKLYQSINSFSHDSFEICVGFNGLEAKSIAAFSNNYPNVVVFAIEWKGYGETKNELAQNASSNWILSIDSDEIADNTLLENLLNVELNSINKVYELQRIQKIGIHQIRYGSFGAPEWKLRLYHKKNAFWNDEKVHEELVWNKDAQIQQLNGILWHLTSDSLADIKNKNDHYAQLSAANMFQKGKKAIILKPALAATMAFIKQYFLKKGILDGNIGWLLAKESARYTFLKYKNLRLLQSQQ